MALREPQPLVWRVRWRTVLKVDSIGIGGAQVTPVVGWKLIEGKQGVFIFLQAVAGFGVFGLIQGDKPIILIQRLGAGIGPIDLVDQFLGLELLTFGQVSSTFAVL